MRMGCAEVRAAVENVWNALFAAEFRGLGGGGCGKLLFHVERLGPSRAEKNAVLGVWDGYWRVNIEGGWKDGRIAREQE
jgi:hypothetical protein